MAIELQFQRSDGDIVAEIPEDDGNASPRTVNQRGCVELFHGLDDRFFNVLDFKVYSLEEMLTATDNFHPSKLLGEGSYGQVFSGVLRDGSEIAVKRLPESARRVIEEEEEFLNEIRKIGAVNHRNIMELLGFCLEGQSPLLVSRKLYSLHTALYEDRALDWDSTYKIAIDVARGLSYLHSGTRRLMVHCDIKPGNILLDPRTLRAYIADFGLVHLGRGHQSEEGLEEIEVQWCYGSRGYRAPEVRSRKRLSAKSDVYSFGKLLYALVSAQNDVENMPPALVRKNVGTIKGFRKLIFKTKIWSMRLFPWVRLLRRGSVLSVLHETLKNDVQKSGKKIMQMAVMIRLIILCTQEDPAMRPSIERVVVELESANMCSIPCSIRAAVKLGFGLYRLLASLLSFLVFVLTCCLVLFVIVGIFTYSITLARKPHERVALLVVLLVVWTVLGFVVQLFLMWTLSLSSPFDELLLRNPNEDIKFTLKKIESL